MSSTNDRDTENMVLRTVFLPPALDDKLRDVAFQRRISKGDLIRTLVIEGLEPTLEKASTKNKGSRKRKNIAEVPPEMD